METQPVLGLVGETSRPLYLDLGPGYCSVYPWYPPKLLSKFRYVQKELGYVEINKDDPRAGRKRGTVKTTVDLFVAVQTAPEDRAIGDKLLFPPGLAKMVRDALIELGVVPTVLDTRIPRPRHSLARLAGLGLRDVQLEDAATLLFSGGGIAWLPTGWGKTRMIAALIDAHDPIDLLARGTPRTVVTLSDADVARKNFRDLQDLLPHRDIGYVDGSVTKWSEDIQVITIDSLDRLPEPERVGILIGDEVHTLASDTRYPQLLAMKNALSWGMSASPFGRFDGADMKTIGLFGPTTVRRSYNEGVARGFLVPLTVCILPMPLPELTNASLVNALSDRDQVLAMCVDTNRALAKTIAEIMQRTPTSRQMLCIAEHTYHLDVIHRELPADTAYVHGQTTARTMADKPFERIGPVSKKARAQMYEDMESGAVRRCLSTYVYKQGVSFNQLEVVICASGGSSKLVYSQIPGRASRPTAGKDHAYIVDFHPGWNSRTQMGRTSRVFGPLLIDYTNRMRTYADLGFEIVQCARVEDLPFLSNK